MKHREDCIILMQQMMDIASSILHEHGTVRPVVGTVKDKQFNFMMLMYESEEGKERAFEKTRDLLVQSRPDFAAFVSEGWAIACHPSKSLKTRPSEDPNRIEVLHVVGATQGWMGCFTKIIQRDDLGRPHVSEEADIAVLDAPDFDITCKIFDGVFEKGPENGLWT